MMSQPTIAAISSPVGSSSERTAGTEALTLCSLPLGFAFRPTDVELVIGYLLRKVNGLPLPANIISEMDVYQFEPWDLTSFSRLRTCDSELYFFCPLYGKCGSRIKRKTPRGYWRPIDGRQAVVCESNIVGFKQTLIYHIRDQKSTNKSTRNPTNWVMKEYRLKENAQFGVTKVMAYNDQYSSHYLYQFDMLDIDEQ
ncbi:NAC domain containing protein 50-like [Magnolia sinica]|uniref:NAC domain containing protein 50-like n=1 Tax=Magnolia sinica TaxID=86752 RepID=UPI0026590982|nr:NAC domain containing protein 50-like [Magnolia sinica]